ncbi:MAG: GIY-YIG nuclease family protein [Bacteroidetes bacterium]|nr:GIY-YIG nuclease family protein [Bacteroidota bacterium]
MYYVYLLESISTGKYYIGQTEKLESRLQKHNKGYVRSTKPYIPWKIIAYKIVETRKEAVYLENKLKKLKKRELQLRYFEENPSSEK